MPNIPLQNQKWLILGSLVDSKMLIHYLCTSLCFSLSVDDHKMMVGSYAPKGEPHMFTTPKEDVPSGMVARGSYNVNNKFIDDDKNIIVEWDFRMEIKKDWE